MLVILSKPALRLRDSRHAGRNVVVSVMLAGTLALISACVHDNGSASWPHGAEPTPKAAATIGSPAAGAKDVPASAEIEFSTKDATSSAVELTDSTGKPVAGALDANRGRWLPDVALAYGATYTATVTATGDDGKVFTAKSTFTTMAKPANQVRASSFLGDGAVVGVGMPLIVKFSRAIPGDLRDDVQRRMVVRSVPPQEGIWRWISPTEVHYRPREFWQPDTKLSYKLQVGGLPMGDGWYGRDDLAVDASVGRSLTMTVDNDSKRMIVTRDGQQIRTILVSLGKTTTPSSSGTMVVIEKLRKTVFDTYDELGPADGYRADIDFAQRLTWGGEFIHAAPWSEGKQGRVNVSHGCVNVSMADGAWLFEHTMVGDPITVTGTGTPLKNGNGWTDWNLSWDEYVKDSAIPYQPAVGPPATPTA
jgi:lipoprotein-anchoring transpeptidase ErfK/SrfK